MICNPHQKEVLYIGRDILSNELIGFCYECVPTANVPLKLLRDIVISIENTKILMIKNFEEKQANNTKTLTKLNDFIIQYKNQQAKKLDSIIQIVKEAIEVTQKKKFSSIDLDKLYDFFEDLGKEKIQESMLSMIQDQLRECSSNSFFIECFEILNKFPSAKSFNITNTEIKNQKLEKIMICKRHNEIVVGVDLTQSSNLELALLCSTCLAENQTQFTSLKEADQIWTIHQAFQIKIHQNLLENSYQINKKITQNFKKMLKTMDEKIQKVYNKFTTYSEIKIQQNQQLKHNWIKLMKNFQFQLISQCDLEHLINIKNFHQQNYQKIESLIENYKLLIKQQFFPSLQFKNFFLKLVKQYQFDEEQLNSFLEYLKDQQFVITQTENCKAIAINHQVNMVVAGKDQLVSVYDFFQGKLKLIQQLKGNNGIVTCLLFMKRSNNFVSAQKELKIWEQQKDGLYTATQTLLGHTKQVTCLLINYNGDQIISGDKLGIITFCKEQKQNWKLSQFFSIPYVFGICMNESETKLLSCSEQFINIFEYIEHKQWSKVQEIKESGNRIGFITDQLFLFQPYNSGEVLFFKFDCKELLFIKKREYSKKYRLEQSYGSDDFWYFPQQFIKQKQILVNKYNKFVNIFKRLDNKEFEIVQSIEYQTEYIYGTMSDDGMYLITWDDESKEIQVRQYPNYNINLPIQ